MAMATRGQGDREALREYVGSYEPVLEAWRAVPSLNVRLDRATAEDATRRVEDDARRQEIEKP